MKRYTPLLSVVITLLISVTPGAAQQEINLQKGLDPYGSYQHGNIDSVSLINGNVNVHVPLLGYPQRGKVRLEFVIEWNVKNWSIHVSSTNGGSNIGGWIYGDGSHAAGVQLVKEQSLYYDFSTATVNAVSGTTYSKTVDLYGAKAPDGSYHAYAQQSSTYSNMLPALDGSGITPIGSTDGAFVGGAYDREGIKYIWADSGYKSVDTEDSNGNKITTSPTGWTDTLGRDLLP